jgi:hypothetical protein
MKIRGFVINPIREYDIAENCVFRVYSDFRVKNVTYIIFMQNNNIYLPVVPKTLSFDDFHLFSQY